MSFWKDVFPRHRKLKAYHLGVFQLSLVFVANAVAICALHRWTPLDLSMAVSPYEVGGTVLGMLLVLRTNAGYDRWWEGRKLWGGIVNQSRNLATIALVYGPTDARWRSDFVRWIVAFSHAARNALRSDTDAPEMAALLGTDAAARISAWRHSPVYLAALLAHGLRQALEAGMDQAAFLRADQERSLLMDHIGGCERILKTPLPRVFAVSLRLFFVAFLATLPFALLPKVGWMTPVVTLFVAFPVLGLDRISTQLQNPFSARNLNHLPLDQICQTIEGDLLELLELVPTFGDEANVEESIAAKSV